MFFEIRETATLKSTLLEYLITLECRLLSSRFYGFLKTFLFVRHEYLLSLLLFVLVFLQNKFNKP